MSIQVRITNVYGRETIYPVDDAAKTFARIAGTKTLTDYSIQQIKQLGYTVYVTRGEDTL